MFLSSTINLSAIRLPIPWVFINKLDSLFSIAYADGELHPKERDMLFEIAKVFQITSTEFESLNNIFEAKISTDNTSINRSYKILGLSENASLEQVSNQYRKLIKEL